MIDSWDWVLRSFECRVQWSAVYAESNSILSRRFVSNCRSTYLFGRFSHFLNYTLLLEVFYFSNKVVLYGERDLSRSRFVRSDIITCVKM